jgi:hypothetical protein
MFKFLKLIFQKLARNDDSTCMQKGLNTDAVDNKNLASEHLNKEIKIDNDHNTFDNAHETLVAFDENLLEKARTQWQFGDWASLTKITREQLQHHPDRAKLALLVAAGHGQSGNTDKLHQFIRLAGDWGCAKRLISQVLISGVHNSLGRAWLATGANDRATLCFRESLSIGSPGSDLKLLLGARSAEQLNQIGLDRGVEFLSSMLSSNPVISDNEHRNIESENDVDVSAALFLHSASNIRLVQECIDGLDLPEAIARVKNQHLKNASDSEGLAFYVLLSDKVVIHKSDKMTALSYLRYACRKYSSALNKNWGAILVERFVNLGQVKSALELITELAIRGHGPVILGDKEKIIIEKANANLHESSNKKNEHGHDLLLDALKKNIDQYKKILNSRTPCVIEIGTTREDVPGQGSTRKIALCCKEHKLDFITIDMDPNNTLLASEMFAELSCTHFQAVSMKGEDFLRAYQGELDFVFLDAYDFDHGGHSEIRQSRYEKFLGSPIDEAQCHQMHLDCAKTVQLKLSKQGLVCVDDTWLEDGNWVAKGTLAMPYLLANGFELIEARNRAAILRRTSSFS